VLIRQAAVADNRQLLDFQAMRAMRGRIPLRFDRSPDYFALHHCHAPDHRTWMAHTEEGELKGIASLVVRDSHLQGRIEPVGYLGDLRLVPDRRLSGAWMAEAQTRLADLAVETGISHAYCCVVRGNRMATQSLLGGRRANTLKLSHWHGYSNVSVYGQRGWRSAPRAQANVRVVQAQSQHLDALRAFLQRESAQQALGCVFSEAEFSRRLQDWPDFSIESFLLALDSRDNVLGCVAPWDAGRIKRIVVEQLALPHQALRVAFNAMAPAFGRPTISAPGRALRDIYLTHLQIRQRNPHVFAALLDAAWAHLRGQYALVQLCLYDGDPLWSAMDRYRTFSIPMDLYTLPCRAGGPTFARESAGRIPGFEIYLV